MLRSSRASWAAGVVLLFLWCGLGFLRAGLRLAWVRADVALPRRDRVRCWLSYSGLVQVLCFLSLFHSSFINEKVQQHPRLHLSLSGGRVCES